jgi:hypothetical protein
LKKKAQSKIAYQKQKKNKRTAIKPIIENVDFEYTLIK